jgi:uncharacterized protein
MNPPLTVLWKRLDVPGHDACRFLPSANGWELAGTAVFRHEGVPALLSYQLTSDADWNTRRGRVRGFVGSRSVELTVERAPGQGWVLDGRALDPAFDACTQLDFGFTPATNFPQLRRLALAIGQAAEFDVLWFDVPPGKPRVLAQRYERRGERVFWYESPSASYAADLELTEDGIIRRYPGLWERVD